MIRSRAEGNTTPFTWSRRKSRPSVVIIMSSSGIRPLLTLERENKQTTYELEMVPKL